MNKDKYTTIMSQGYDELIVPVGFEDIINRLAEERVFGLKNIEEDLWIGEQCDEWFGMKLTKDDCITLSNMFKFISDNFY